ncbi:hypothetical protein [Schlesneria sp. T3-172]|uniref:hypothetical protein n=1 Tax=Schlesneria sphaerica TaxID=3373610 RepID=UPI0037C95D2B
MEDDLAGSCVELLRDVEWQRTPQAEYGPHLPWGVDELKGYAEKFASHVIQSLAGMGITFHPIPWTESPQPEHEVVTREAAKRDRLRWLDDAFLRLSSLVDERKELPRGWELELPKYALNTADAFSRWLGETITSVARANDLSFGRSAVRHAHLWLLANVPENRPAWPADPATVSGCIQELERLKVFISPPSVTPSHGCDPLPEPHPDGPEAPNKIWINGKSRQLQPKAFAMINYMWGKSQAHESHVMKTMWKPNKDPVDGTFSNSVTMINNAFLELDYPKSLKRRDGFLVFE